MKNGKRLWRETSDEGMSCIGFASSETQYIDNVKKETILLRCCESPKS